MSDGTIPISSNFGLIKGTMKEVKDSSGKTVPGNYTMQGTDNKSYTVSIHNQLYNSTVTGTAEGKNYVQTATDSNAIKINVSVFPTGANKSKSGLPENSTKIFGGEFSYSKDNTLKPDSNDTPQEVTTKSIVNDAFNSGKSMSGSNLFCTPTKANASGENTVKQTEVYSGGQQPPAQTDSIKDAMMNGTMPDSTGQTFFTKQ